MEWTISDLSWDEKECEVLLKISKGKKSEVKILILMQIKKE